MISIILIEPENSGNVGAIARSMKNFDLKNLILINPKCSHLSSEAIARSKHAKDILKKAKVRKSIPTSFDYLAATTSQVGSDYNIPRSPITPEQLAEKIKNKKAKIGILLGREGKGLSNKEVQECDFIITIEASKRYPVMNVSHAAAILFYEIYKKIGKHKIAQNFNPATNVEKDQVLKILKQSLKKLPFATKEKKQTQIKVWKRLIGKSFLTKREAYALMGFLKKIIKK